MDIASIIYWVIFGAVAGWLASIIMRTNAQQGALANIIIGIVGAFIGGWLFGVIGLGDGTLLWNFISAVVGSVVLIFIARLIRR